MVNARIDQLFLIHLLTDAVNELSNTIDLQSTLIRAEALFRRFQRTVEAIDKKHSFPTPSIRQRKPRPSDESSVSVTVTGTQARESIGKAVAKGNMADKEKVISPELRQLLSRKIETLDKQTVVEHGGGVS